MKTLRENWITPGAAARATASGPGQQISAEEGGPRLRGVGTSAGVAAQATTDPAAQEEGSNRPTATGLPAGLGTSEKPKHSSSGFSMKGRPVYLTCPFGPIRRARTPVLRAAPSVAVE